MSRLKAMISRKADLVGGKVPTTQLPLPFTSQPPQGAYKVINLWIDPDSGKLTIQYDNTPTP